MTYGVLVLKPFFLALQPFFQCQLFLLKVLEKIRSADQGTAFLPPVSSSLQKAHKKFSQPELP